MKDSKSYFDSVDPKCNFQQMENDLLKYWYEKKIVEKYLNKNSGSNKYFSFLDGPITANNPMGVHHAWGRTYKDVWQRFKNMKGFKQRFQNGFDCQGLWVEVEVEKELNFKNKKDIDKYGVAEFIQKCKDRVIKYSKIQTDQTIRLGNFMNWDHSYFTMSDENNYMIWHFLKKCREKGLIYKGSDVVPWCYRCETAISEHEILTEDYKDIEHISVYLRFPIVGKKDEYLLVWTTTPWTIPANIAVAVDSNKDYSQVLYRGKKYWLLQNRVKSIFSDDYKILKNEKGESLIGLKYLSPFDSLPVYKDCLNSKLFRSVIATDTLIMPITEDEGTGLVHTSTGTGAEDHKLGKKIGLPIIGAIFDNADYLDSFGELAGKNAKKEPEIIFDILKNKDNGEYLFNLVPYKHRYPACWRCKSELVWKLADEWYIKIDPVREDMKKVAKKIKWIPAFGLKRELDWLSNMHDWLISKKNRYWGLALPIWECNCGHFEVMGGYDELKKLAIEGWNEFENHTPHKPYIDNIKIQCPECGKTVSRIPDVGNPWLDAGIVPFSTITSDNMSKPLYLSDKNEFNKWFPADFITESFPGQFKNWFYAVLAMSTIMENKIPYKTVLGFATLLAEDGRPMHKSWGNSIEFNEGAEKIGADVMRWMYLCARPSDNLLFGYKSADETRRRFYLKLWNFYNYFITYANIDLYIPEKELDLNKNKLSLLDKWVLSRLSQTLKETENYLEKFDALSTTASIENFVNDFSNWYIRRSRDRTGLIATDKEDKKAFYDTTFTVLTILTKMLAPLLPFISEIIYKNLSKNVSVHLEAWPEFNYIIDEKLLIQMNYIRDAAESVHSERKILNIPLRQKLLSADILTKHTKPEDKLVDILLLETNIEKINWIKKGDALKTILNTETTPELEENNKTRLLMRKIQNERKVLGVKLTDEVSVENDWIPNSELLLKQLKEKTLTKNIVLGKEFKVSK